MKQYKRRLERAERLRAKRDRLECLEALYFTYENLGHQPFPGSEMQLLRQRIQTARVQLKAMGEGIGPDEAGRE